MSCSPAIRTLLILKNVRAFCLQHFQYVKIKSAPQRSKRRSHQCLPAEKERGGSRMCMNCSSIEHVCYQNIDFLLLSCKLWSLPVFVFFSVCVDVLTNKLRSNSTLKFAGKNLEENDNLLPRDSVHVCHQIHLCTEHAKLHHFRQA